MKCAPAWTVRKFGGYSEREIDIYSLRNADAGRSTETGRRKKSRIRVAAGPDCEVGVKRCAYCRRNLLFARTFLKRSGEMLCSDCGADGFGIKIVWFFGGFRGGSNKIIHCQLAFTLISEKELPPGRKCCADWG